MGHTDFVMKRRLDANDIAQIKHLEDVCNRAEGIRIKFNWGMMQERDGSYFSDFCYYRDGQLVGYAPLDAFGGAFEVTAAVLPACRRQGIFRTLLEAARKEAYHCKATELLLVSYPAADTGKATVAQMELTYRFSEYRMGAAAASLPPLPASRIDLEDVTADNVAELSRLLGISFANSRWNEPEFLLKELESEHKRYFLARLDDEIVGQIGVVNEDEVAYIRAVGIVPDRRGRGYGRQLLSATVQKLLVDGYAHFELDVATGNRHALSLYQSCGFRETTVYDYHTVPLA